MYNGHSYPSGYYKVLEFNEREDYWIFTQHTLPPHIVSTSASKIRGDAKKVVVLSGT